MSWSAFATFTEHGSEVFRTKTELRVGQGAHRLLGVILMINPGSSKGRPDSTHEKATVDSTMRAVISIVEEAYRAAGAALSDGDYIQINNLFDICEPDLQAAISKYRRIRSETPPNPHVHCSVNSIPKGVPWVWLAWGSEHHDQLLASAMKETLSKLTATIIGAKIANQTVGYYHPLYMQRVKNRKPEIRMGVLAQLQSCLLS